MTTYVIRLSHPPDQCPTSNSKVRALVFKMGPSIAEIGERLGVKIVTGPLVMASEHESVSIVEAETVEAVNDFLLETALIQWNTCRVSMAQPMANVLGELDKAPAPLY